MSPQLRSSIITPFETSGNPFQETVLPPGSHRKVNHNHLAVISSCTRQTITVIETFSAVPELINPKKEDSNPERIKLPTASRTDSVRPRALGHLDAKPVLRNFNCNVCIAVLRVSDDDDDGRCGHLDGRTQETGFSTWNVMGFVLRRELAEWAE